MIRFTFFFLIFLVSCQSGPVEIYVSPSGDDQDTGGADNPVRSLHKALDMVREIKQRNANWTVWVWVRSGTYYLPEPLLFTPAHSGTTEQPVRISAYPKEKVIISGARPLDLRWERTEGPILTASLEVDFSFDQLFIDDVQQIRARYPNFDPETLIYNGYAADAVAPERIGKWARPQTGILHAMHRAEWGGYHYRITGVGPDGAAVLDGGYQNNRQMGMHPEYRFVENIREELDAPNEWYYDQQEGRLYYFPGPDFRPEEAQVEVATLDHLVEFRGSEQAPVHDIRLEGFTFRHTRSTYLQTREPLLRSDWTIYRGGALLLEGTENVGISHSHLHQLGGNGIFVNNYNRHTTIATNHFEQIGASAICFVGNPAAVRSPSFEYHEFVHPDSLDREPGPRSGDYPASGRVHDNLIHDIGTIEKQVAGIQLSMSSEITLSHNSIYHTPRAGINISEGTWGGHLIEHNDVFNTVLETGDHGAFNSWGRDRFWHPNRTTMDSLTRVEPALIRLDALEPTVIRNNRFRCDHGWDIDLDDGSSNYHIYNNLCLNGGIKLREGFYRTVENNIMVNNSFHPHVWFANSHDIFRRNIIMTAYKPIRIEDWGEEIDYNFLPDSAALARSQALGLDAHSLYGNPGFIAPEAGDFRVRNDSPALLTGFQNFPMDQFGVQDPRLKARAASPEITMPFYAAYDQQELALIDFLGAQVSNVQGLAERSAAGLSAEAGIMVRELAENSVAYRQGLRAGDVIIGLNDEKVDHLPQLMEQFQGERWKGQIELRVIRNQKEEKLNVRL